MIVPYWIVEHELMVSISPIVADSLVAVNDESVHTKNLETGSDRQASLSST